MYEYPVYEAKGKDNHINIMIIGAGNIGLEIAKATAWCSQMTSRTFSVKIFDKDKKNEKADFPFRGLKEKLSKIGTPVDLEFIECDIFSDRFDALRFERADYIARLDACVNNIRNNPNDSISLNDFNNLLAEVANKYKENVVSGVTDGYYLASGSEYSSLLGIDDVISKAFSLEITKCGRKYFWRSIKFIGSSIYSNNMP